MPEGAVHAHVERILQRHTGQGELTKRILELNPDHDILVSMTAMHQADPESVRVKDWIELLYDQALMAEGSPVSDPARFASHVTSLLKQVSAQG